MVWEAEVLAVGTLPVPHLSKLGRIWQQGGFAHAMLQLGGSGRYAREMADVARS